MDRNILPWFKKLECSRPYSKYLDIIPVLSQINPIYIPITYNNCNITSAK